MCSLGYGVVYAQVTAVGAIDKISLEAVKLDGPRSDIRHRRNLCKTE